MPQTYLNCFVALAATWSNGWHELGQKLRVRFPSWKLKYFVTFRAVISIATKLDLEQFRINSFVTQDFGSFFEHCAHSIFCLIYHARHRPSCVHHNKSLSNLSLWATEIYLFQKVEYFLLLPLLNRILRHYRGHLMSLYFVLERLCFICV